MTDTTTNPIQIGDVPSVEALPKIFRKTLAYNPDVMLCHFTLLEGADIPLHNHLHTQIGYVLHGQVRFKTEESEFIARSGDSYVFKSHQKHGAFAIAETELIEIFSPCREEYKVEP